MESLTMVEPAPTIQCCVLRTSFTFASGVDSGSPSSSTVPASSMFMVFETSSTCPELLGGDAGDEVVVRGKLLFAAEVERLEHVVVEGGHLAEPAPEKLLGRRRRVRVCGAGLGKLDLQLVYA